MIENALKLADEIAQKSPVAVQATKKNLIYSMDHTTQDGLNHIVRFYLYIERVMFIFGVFVLF